MTAPRWVVIDKARNVGEATLLKDALVQEGVQAELRGEHRPSIAGELPLPEAMVEVWVPEEEADGAVALLERFRKEEEGPPQSCPRCGEENPASFGQCWKCEKVL